MAQTQYTEQDAWSLTEKLADFTETLSPGEQAAWEALERHVSTLVPTEDEDVGGQMVAPDSVNAPARVRQQELRDEASRTSAGRARAQRQSLWFRLVTTLNPPQR